MFLKFFSQKAPPFFVVVGVNAVQNLPGVASVPQPVVAACRSIRLLWKTLTEMFCLLQVYLAVLII